MQRLIDLVEAARCLKTLEERLRCAEQLLSAVGPELRGHILRRCSVDQAEDILMETIEGVTRNLHQFFTSRKMAATFRTRS